MNTSTDSGTFYGSYAVGGFTYGIGISIGILLLITTITIASYFCAKTTSRDHLSGPSGRNVSSNDVVLDIGIDEETIKTYPKVMYSDAKKEGRGGLSSTTSTTTTSNCCSICLADYKGSDMLRMLPECHHFFHVKCVDPWLRLHPTCPVCRTSPLPSPLSTPLAEVVPLASRRD